MKKVISVLTFCLLVQFNVFAIELDYLRANYDKAVTDKKLCSQMIEDLKEAEQTPLFLAYLGALQTIWANHIFSPISKLNTFNQGKKNIEKAVSADKDNAEIRFIRLSVQKNAPSFLGYNSMIKTDEAFLKTHRTKITSELVQSKIDILLKK